MRITILGAGAMGSLFGGLLAEQGHDVELLDVNPTHIEKVRNHGLTLETEGKGARVVRLPIARPQAAASGPDCLILFTKTLHTQGAMESVRHVLDDRVLVLTLQNGLGNAERVAAFLPMSRIAVGVTTVPADMIEPGHVHSHGAGHNRMMMADGRPSDALQALAEALTQAGLPSTLDATVQAAIWQKAAFNAALNTVCAVTCATVGQVGRQPQARELAHDIATEVLAVASANGIAVDAKGLHDTLDHALDHHLQHKPSMLQDLLAGRRTEVDAINGEVLRVARWLGIDAPRTQALDALIRVREVLVLNSR
ncbi:ketopantoate reductase family protein [Thiomonas sp. FB-6]|uniref:ketopantoate reductase family protein n=1 Tax=Thiomonas sp. FB-6 TaxID=1158291 RepID=UPI00036E06F9|nr:2-dehydropantoate 2-reductase [Thiomonas sp. FB-6]